jgi:hypothetical protein
MPIVSNGLTYLPDEGSVKSKLATVVISSKRVSILTGDNVENRRKHFREKCYRLHIEMFQVLMPYTVLGLRPCQTGDLNGIL